MEKNNNQNKEQNDSTTNTDSTNHSSKVRTTLVALAYLMSTAYLGGAIFTGSEIADADEQYKHLTQSKEKYISSIRDDFRSACVADQVQSMINKQLQEGSNISIEFNSDSQRTEGCMTNKATQYVEGARNQWKEVKENRINDAALLLTLAGCFAAVGYMIRRKQKQDQSPGNKPPKP